MDRSSVTERARTLSGRKELIPVRIVDNADKGLHIFIQSHGNTAAGKITHIIRRAVDGVYDPRIRSIRPGVIALLRNKPAVRNEFLQIVLQKIFHRHIIARHLIGNRPLTLYGKIARHERCRLTHDLLHVLL